MASEVNTPSGDKFVGISREAPDLMGRWKPEDVQCATIKLTSPMRTSLRTGSQIVSVRVKNRFFSTEDMAYDLAKRMYERDFGTLPLSGMQKFVTFDKDFTTMELIVDTEGETTRVEVGGR